VTWSTHCNTEVARWSLRERGIAWAAEELDALAGAAAPGGEERARGFDPDDAPPPGQAGESRAFAACARDRARAWQEPPTA
jgi:hypothetical protein